MICLPLFSYLWPHHMRSSCCWNYHSRQSSSFTAVAKHKNTTWNWPSNCHTKQVAKQQQAGRSPGPISQVRGQEGGGGAMQEEGGTGWRTGEERGRIKAGKRMISVTVTLLIPYSSFQPRSAFLGPLEGSKDLLQARALIFPYPEATLTGQLYPDPRLLAQTPE